jgi:hypothetical protein
MSSIPLESRQRWKDWVHDNVAPPFRKRALKASVSTLNSGGTADAAIAAAKQAERNRANYMALSALILGALSAAVALFAGGVSVLATLFATASAVQGRRSTDRAWQAWTGLGLAVLGVVLFAVRLVLPA